MKTSLIYSKKEIDRAGKTLTEKNQNIEQEIQILENFRSIHIRPLLVFRMLLQNKLIKLNFPILISQRLKRTPSIIKKLQNNENMSLSQMQDIGGLRVVLDSIAQINKLKEVLEESEKQPAFKSILFKPYDYIKNPKPDTGYISLHLVYKFEKVPENEKCRIEIQIRTKVQHAWATAVEVVGTYLNQQLKQGIGAKDLLNLFKKISFIFSQIENNEELDKTIIEEIRKESVELRLEHLLLGFKVATDTIDKDIRTSKNKFFLITLNFKERFLQIQPFSKSQSNKAVELYSILESKYNNDNNFQVVLVSVDNINNLRKLYPNYFLDTEEFINLLKNKVIL